MFDNFNLLDIIADVFHKHGPAVAAVEKSFSPGDFSIRFFLQLAGAASSARTGRCKTGWSRRCGWRAYRA